MLGLCVQPVRWLVKQQERRLPQDRSRNSQTLTLSAGKSSARLLQIGIVLLEKSTNKLIGICLLSSSNHLCFARPRSPISNIFAHTGTEEHGLLRDQRYLLAQTGQSEVADVSPVKQYLPFLRIIKALDEMQDAALASTRVTDQGHHHPRKDVERYMLQGRALLFIAKTHMLERDSTLQAGYRHCDGTINNCRTSLDQIR